MCIKCGGDGGGGGGVADDDVDDDDDDDDNSVVSYTFMIMDWLSLIWPNTSVT